MTHKKKRRSKRDDEHAHFIIHVERHDASVDAAVNHDVYAPQYAWSNDERGPLYEFRSRLRDVGTVNDPPNHIGHTFEMMLYGDDASSRHHDTSVMELR